MGCSYAPKESGNNKPNRTNNEEVETIVNQGNNELNKGIKLIINDNYTTNLKIKETIIEAVDVEKRIKEEEERKIKEEKEKRIKEEKEKRIKEEKEKRIKEEEERRIKEEKERRIKEEKERRIKEEEERKIKEEKERKIKEEKERKIKEEKERKIKEEEERRIKEEEEKRIKEEKERKIKEEEERKIKEEEERRIKEEEERKIKIEEERKIKEEEEKRIKEEEERKIKEEEERKNKIFKEKEENLKKEYEDLLKKETEERNKLENDSIRWSEYEKLKVDYHSISEIRERFLDSLKNEKQTIKYSTEPKIKYPYKLGKISKESLDIAIKYFNCLRYIAGIPYDVGINKQYQELSEAASLLMAINKLMAHSGQPKPNKMDDKLFKLGDKGCNSCNICLGCYNLIDSINCWISDSGCFNTMGHRRWILNPPMKNTGFGLVSNYSSMYCFDKTFEDSEYKNVAWPAQNMPIEVFKNNDIWTISLGKKINCNDIEVNLKNYNNGEILKFSNNCNNNKFVVLNSNYGQVGCIVFHPNLCYKDGDYFRVDIKGTDIAISYDVKFFSARCIHETELIGNINPTCIKKGNQTFYCKICNIKTNKEIDMIPHDYKINDEIKPTCIKKGIQNLICNFCNIKTNKEIDMIPHDYEYKIIDKNSGKCEGKCNFCKKIISFNSPTNIKFFWKNNVTTEGEYYWSYLPSKNPIGSIIKCDIKINGDKNYRDVIFEVSDKNLLGLPEQIEEYNDLHVLKEGDVDLIIYPKYNPELKYTFSLHLG